jgi:hypothetical protein
MAHYDGHVEAADSDRQARIASSAKRAAAGKAETDVSLHRAAKLAADIRKEKDDLLRQTDGLDNRKAALHPDTWEAHQVAMARHAEREACHSEADLLAETNLQKAQDEETRRSRVTPEEFQERTRRPANVADLTSLFPDPNPHARHSGSGRDPWDEPPLFPAMARDAEVRQRIKEGLEVIDPDLATYITRRCKEIECALSSVKVSAGDQCQVCEGLTFNTYDVCDDCVTKMNLLGEENVRQRLEIASLHTDNASMELKLIMYRAELKELKSNG